MTEIQDREARLQKLLERRGEDLVRGLIEEFGRLHREVASLKRELTALSAYQAAHDRQLVIDAAVTKIFYMPRAVSIEADQNLRSQDGFYPLEHTSDGIPFRWTGPSPQFSFDLFVDRSSFVELRLDALNCIDFEVQGNIALLVDGESVPTHVEREDLRIGVTAVLPPRSGNETTNLVFVLPAALVPPGPEDTRALGLAFSRLRVAVRDALAAGIDASSADEIDEIGLGDSAAAE